MDSGPATQKLTILGSTGSVGRSAVEIVRQYRDRFEVMALTGNGNIDLLAEQAKELCPQLAVTANAQNYNALKSALSGTGIEVAAGMDGLLQAASIDTDVTVAGIIGFAGLRPTFAALAHAKRLAFASKECLVCTGDLFLNEAKKHGCRILPIDSEHSAIFQLLEHSGGQKLDKIILTASGGPFLNYTKAQLRDVKPEQAANHPIWKMGQKISIDSATMMNKGLELIEAHYLFGLPSDQIDVLIHPEGIVHGMIAFQDGSVLTHMGIPDMRIPIAYALFWPDRQELTGTRFDPAKLSRLNFQTPDNGQFPSLGLARRCLEGKTLLPLAYNAANEVAVDRFIVQNIDFISIFSLVEDMLGWASQNLAFSKQGNNLDHIIELDQEVRRQAQDWTPQDSTFRKSASR